ncbi:CAP domain-containing protein [Streptomyces melanogenes]|uniref:CAP domain-containing protein n=1 Tax=Streptomyces melanogenes TaxID=67326 RepID=A0ABZ1XSW2_9ACTN|nr:CAP domain-containing protein [Streptomyces melanogenes]
MQHHDDHPHVRPSASEGRAGRRRAHRQRSRQAVGTAVAGTVAVAAVAGALLWPHSDDPAEAVRTQAAPPAGHPLDTGATPAAATPSASPSPIRTDAPAKTASPKPRPTRSAPASGSTHTGTGAGTGTGTTTAKGHTGGGQASRKTTPPRTDTAPTGTAAAYVQQVVDLANAERAKAGCSPFKADRRLNASAQAHADDMAARDYYEHNSPEGRNAGDRMSAAGYDWHKWGENIHRGPKTPADAMRDWMNSPGHRANLLDCGFKDIGVGVNLSGNGPWWVQNFGS